jgi:hypothetical protein
MAYKEQAGNSGVWLPEEKGAILEGEVLEVVEGQYGRQISVQDIKTMEIIKTPSHKALQCRLVHVKVMDKVRITYLGQELPTVKGFKGTRLYKVEVDEPVEEEVV